MAVDHATGLPHTQPETQLLLLSIFINRTTLQTLLHQTQLRMPTLSTGFKLFSSVFQECLPSMSVPNSESLQLSLLLNLRINLLTALTCADWSSVVQVLSHPPTPTQSTSELLLCYGKVDTTQWPMFAFWINLLTAPYLCFCSVYLYHMYCVFIRLFHVFQNERLASKYLVRLADCYLINGHATKGIFLSSVRIWQKYSL